MTNKPPAILEKNRLRSIKAFPPLTGTGDWAAQAAACDLLQRRLPGHWIVQPRPWDGLGSHCLLEIVDEGHVLNGCCAWIQVQAVAGIRWNRQGQYRCGAIRPPAAYRPPGCAYPVLLCLADLVNAELYFLCVEGYIQAHFADYLRTGRLLYCFDRRRHRLPAVDGCRALERCLVASQERQALENAFTLALAAPERLARSTPLPDLAALLRGPLAYWAFTNRRVYYYLHSLHCAQKPMTHG